MKFFAKLVFFCQNLFLIIFLTKNNILRASIQPPVLPRQTRRQVLSSCLRAAGMRAAASYPRLRPLCAALSGVTEISSLRDEVVSLAALQMEA